MGNTHDTEIARLEADFIHNRWKTTGDYRWGYSSDRGPESWWVYYPSASGCNQSPIDIITEDVTFDPDLCANPLQVCYQATETEDEGDDDDDDDYPVASPFFFPSSTSSPFADGGGTGMGVGLGVAAVEGTFPRESMELINTGNMAKINVFNSQSYITGGPCRDHLFRLKQIHFHWGEADDVGSEHLINTQSHAAEVHLVHWNEELFTTYDEATKKEDGIVILAVFVQVSQDNDPCKALSFIAGQLQDVSYRDQSVSLPNTFNASVFLPDDVTRYWTYKGSFTTPPCFETVTWILFSNPIQSSSRDLQRFRQLRSYRDSEVIATADDEADGQILKNRRTVQPLGTRRIYSASAAGTGASAAGTEEQTTGYEDAFRSVCSSSSQEERIFAFDPTFQEFARQCLRA